ncbi:MAG: histidine phosphatase family protein [Pseudomonadota bacterium]
MDEIDPTTPTGRKTLLLMRHAKSSWDDSGLADFERPLNKRGKQAARAVAPLIAAWQPHWIGCSTAKRTRQTLMPILEELPTPTEISLLPALYESNEAAYLRMLRALPSAIDRALVIGHNPVMEDLTSLLIGSAEPRALERISEKFPTGTLVVLECAISRWSDLAPHCANLLDTIRPRDLMEPS